VGPSDITTVDEDSDGTLNADTVGATPIRTPTTTPSSSRGLLPRQSKQGNQEHQQPLQKRHLLPHRPHTKDKDPNAGGRIRRMFVRFADEVVLPKLQTYA
jgi:hypothetical protein